MMDKTVGQIKGLDDILNKGVAVLLQERILRCFFSGIGSSAMQR